ncbi:MAG: hypothetical protein Q9N26_00720 [Aquificota bacterium]|nr:hypothetical protein [Aquificota bacterium]
MMLTLFALVLFGLAFPGWEEDIRSFFTREGYVVEVSGDRVYLDLGEGRVSVGERFKVIAPGKEIVHPVTGEVLGTAERDVGLVRVLEVKEKYSVAEVLENRGIEKGQKVRVLAGIVCFSGDGENLFRLRSLLGEVKSGEDCEYVIREFPGGYGVEFRGRPVAFFEREKPAPAGRPYTPEDFTFRARFVMSFGDIPLSADVCDLFGKGKEYLAVLFENKLEFYEILKGEPVKFASMYLPAGFPVSVQCADLEGTGRDLLLINMVSDGKANSAIAKVVGESPVIVSDRIPFIMAVLDKSRPIETFLGQRFEGEWGEVKRLRFTGNSVTVVGDFQAPPGFRIDGAVYAGDMLVFTDTDGYLRVYRGQDQLLSEEGFGTSYTSAQMPVTYGEEEGEEYYFFPRPFRVRVMKWDLVGVIRNVTSPVFKFLNVSKFVEGEIHLILSTGKGPPVLKKVQGRKLEEALQAVVVTRGGRVFAITGRKGTIPLQNGGDLFELEINPI